MKNTNDTFELDGLELYPIIINPESINKIKKFVKEGMIGATDLFTLYVSIIQWNTLNKDWQKANLVYEELGFSEEYTQELLDWMLSEKILTMCE